MLLLFAIGFICFINIQALLAYALMHPVVDDVLAQTTQDLFPGWIDFFNTLPVAERQQMVIHLTAGAQGINVILACLIYFHWVQVLKGCLMCVLLFAHLGEREQ